VNEDDCHDWIRQLSGCGVMACDAGDQSWTGLSPVQADGQACVICGRSVHTTGSVHVPIGHSVTGSQVYTCTGFCANLAQPPAGLLPIPDEALTAGGVAFLHVLERATPTCDPWQAYPDDLVATTVRAAAPLIVAAELRRLATEIEGNALGHQHLRERAYQLDPCSSGDSWPITRTRRTPG
jgi:hypothetical protein